MCSPDLTYNDDTGLYEDEDGNSYYDTEGTEPYRDDD